MGKKGGWFSAIRRAFTKDKPSHGPSGEKRSKAKRKGKGILSHGEAKSFIPRFREPSSIEKILGEADELLIRPPAYFQQPNTSPAFLCTPVASSPRISSARITYLPSISTPGGGSSWLTKATQRQKEVNRRLEPPLKNLQVAAATKIQAALRGYLARRNFRALRGLVRLQAVVRSENVKRQTTNAMKQMQLLVRVQMQIQSRRIQMFENQAIGDGNNEATLNQVSEAAHSDDWDDSVLTKEEIEARLQKKVEAVVKRERTMAYAYSHQLWKANPKSTRSPPDDILSNGLPWWWSWLERRLPPSNSSQTTQSTTKNATLCTPLPVLVSDNNPSGQPNGSSYIKHRNFTSNNHEAVQLKSPRSTIPVRTKKFQTPTGMPPPDNTPLRDDDSLTSCPPFSVPNYMNSTVSAKAKAKARAISNPKERIPAATPGNDSKRRFSFPLTPNIGSFKWNNKGPSAKGAAASEMKVLEKHRRSEQPIGDLSIDSTVSMPAVFGRKPFNRFV